MRRPWLPLALLGACLGAPAFAQGLPRTDISWIAEHLPESVQDGRLLKCDSVRTPPNALCSAPPACCCSVAIRKRRFFNAAGQYQAVEMSLGAVEAEERGTRGGSTSTAATRSRRPSRACSARVQSSAGSAGVLCPSAQLNASLRSSGQELARIRQRCA
jgi:hypothetical protein